MVVTVLEARVDEGRWAELESGYEGITAKLPPQLVATSLLQAAEDRTLWRVQTTWKSRQALQEYRASVDTPDGVLLFRQVGVEPTLTVFDTVVRVENAEAASASQ